MPGTILITGGGRGIGAALVRKAAKKGFERIAFCYRSNRDTAQQLHDEVTLAGAQCLAIQADVSKPEDIERMFTEVDSAFGTLDALVNNAGIVAPSSRVDNYTAARVTQMMSINVVAPIMCAKQAVQRMSTQCGGKGGVIVNVSSIAASLGSPGEYVDYAASKAAVDTFTLGLGKEVADEGIRVVAVRPGLIDTDLHADSGDRQRPFKLQHNIPMKKVGTAEQVADTIMWLLSDEASYITATTLDVSGGR